MLNVCIPGSNKLKGNVKMTLKFTLEKEKISIFIHILKEKKREKYGRNSQANIALESRDLGACKPMRVY